MAALPADGWASATSPEPLPLHVQTRLAAAYTAMLLDSTGKFPDRGKSDGWFNSTRPQK